MKSALRILAVLLLVSCNNDKTNDSSLLIQHLDIGDAKELFVSCEKQSPGLSDGEYSLHKIKYDGSVAPVHIRTNNGNNIDCMFAVIGNYNSSSIFLRIGNYNAASETVYIVDKKSGYATKAPDNVVFIGNASNDLYSGNTYSYNDNEDNLYYFGHYSGKSNISIYTPHLSVINLTEDYDVDSGREFAIDSDKNLVAQIYQETWLYRSNDGMSHVFPMPYVKYTSYEQKSRVFGLKNKVGFFFIADKILYNLKYNDSSKNMEATIVSQQFNNDCLHYFGGIFYYSNKTLMVSPKGAMIMDDNYNIITTRFTGVDHYGSHFYKARNSFIWFYDSYTKARKFDLETQQEEGVYNLTGYRIDGVAIEPDESITIYGLKTSTGKKIIANVKNGVVASEVEWTNQPYVENSHWLKLDE